MITIGTLWGEEVIEETRKCNYYIESEKKIPDHVKGDLHPFGSVYLSKKSVSMVLPLLRRQPYLNYAEEYKNQNIDIDLNFFRKLLYMYCHQQFLRN